MPSKKAARRKAAKKARAAWKGFTPDGLERLRAAARERRPWERSTGPRTEAGKARSRRNAIREGFKADATLPPLLLQVLADLRAARRGGPLPPVWLVDLAANSTVADPAQPIGVGIRALEIKSWFTRMRLREVSQTLAAYRAGHLPPGW